ncbi:MAG TPA: allophanate hydrolase [Pseudomonadales bacterium]|nr:allophanate hydrolase [Pseudomonadales bacterium]
MLPDRFSIAALRNLYLHSEETPQSVLEKILVRIARDKNNPVWIHVLSTNEIAAYIENLSSMDIATHPLWGIPFAIKDNIDLANIPTTTACPAFAYTPTQHAAVVEKLINAGAIPIGKTNLDQFATGLVGTRSPYGEVKNAYVPEYISGGSSSGSAVAIALGHVAFALGTDTAGSGRVPASLNHLVGVKPSKGLLSTTGVVPACRSLDCVSLFAHNSSDARLLLQLTQGFDAQDVYSRHIPLTRSLPDIPVIGVPHADQLDFFGNHEAQQLFGKTIADLHAKPVKMIEIDFAPFMEAAQLLYQGPWVTERWLVAHDIMDSQPDAMLQVTRSIIAKGKNFSSADHFTAQYRLAYLRRAAEKILQSVDVIITPTIGSPYTRADIAAEPVKRNSELGYYTNFMNLLDLAALAIPTTHFPNGLPNGITLFADHGTDATLLSLAEQLFPESHLF